MRQNLGGRTELCGGNDFGLAVVGNPDPHFVAFIPQVSRHLIPSARRGIVRFDRIGANYIVVDSA